MSTIIRHRKWHDWMVFFYSENCIETDKNGQTIVFIKIITFFSIIFTLLCLVSSLWKVGLKFLGAQGIFWSVTIGNWESSSLNKYILLDVLVCSIAVSFYKSCSILVSPKVESKDKWVKIYSFRFRFPKILTCQGFWSFTFVGGMRRVQISCDICTRFARYLSSTKQSNSWITKPI